VLPPVIFLGVVSDPQGEFAPDAPPALRASEVPFRLLVEAVEGYAIFMVDPDARIVSWNAGARRIKGYEADEVLGRPLSLSSATTCASRCSSSRRSPSSSTSGSPSARGMQDVDLTELTADVVRHAGPRAGRAGSRSPS
jgi:hypothetical protein